MAGGPLWPHSVVPVTAGKVWPGVHTGGGSGSKYDEGMQVLASLDADATVSLRFQLPPTLPSGTCKLQLWALAAATTGNAKVNPKHAQVAAEEDPSSATLNAEGTSTLSWGSGDTDQYKELLITLDASGTLVAGKILVMNLVFETSSWTLAVNSTWIIRIVWV